MAESNFVIPINKGQFVLDTPERIANFEINRGFGVAEAYRANRLAWEDLPRRQFTSDYPLHVDIELASICNLRCPMCYTITKEFKQKVNVGLMDFDLFKKIIDECASGGVYSVRLSFRGESFIHKDIVECIKYAKDRGIKEVSTLTNGLRLDEEMFTKIMNAGLDWLTISFDGLGNTYEEIRRPAIFERAFQKIVNYSQIKKDAGSVKPVIKVQSIFPAIEDNPSAFYETFAPYVDLVASNPLIDFLQSKSDQPKIPNFSCPQIYQRLVIGSDGLCMMCSNDEDGSRIVGDVNKSSIHQVWHGEKLNEVREIHKRCAGAAEISACAQCYLPLQTYQETVALGDREVVAEKYLKGKQKVFELNTPEKFKRKDIKI